MVLVNYPNALNIFLTKRCNLGCQYCFVNKDGPKGKELDIESLRKALDIFLLFPRRYKTISFNGGEPLIRFGKIKKLYQYMHYKNNGNSKLVVAITTNGTLLTESRYKFLKKHKITIKVSIDGKKIIHDYNRPFKQKEYGSSYERIVNNLKQLDNHKDEEYKICSVLVFTPATVKGLIKNIKSLWRLGFDYIDFYPELYSQWSEEELDNTELAFREFTDFYLSIFKNTKRAEDIFENSLLHTFVKEKELYRPILCQKIHLDWKGNFYCCDKAFSLPEVEREEFIIGDINKGIDNRLRLKLLEQKRKEIRNLTGKDCGICKYVKYCFCPIGHYIYFSSKGGNFKEYFPQFCRLSNIYIDTFLYIFSRLKTNPLFNALYTRH